MINLTQIVNNLLAIKDLNFTNIQAYALLAPPPPPDAHGGRWFGRHRVPRDKRVHFNCRYVSSYVPDHVILLANLIPVIPQCADDLLLHFPYEDHYDDVTCHQAIATKNGDGVSLQFDPERNGNVACFTGGTHFEVSTAIDITAGPQARGPGTREPPVGPATVTSHRPCWIEQLLDT